MNGKLLKTLSDHCRYVTKRYAPRSANKMIEMTFIPEGAIYHFIAHGKLTLNKSLRVAQFVNVYNIDITRRLHGNRLRK